MKITIYSNTTCPYCRMLTQYLTEKGVTFTEKMTDQNQVVQEEMAALSGGFLGVPFTVIEKEGQEPETVIGFDKKRINSIVGIQ